MRGWTSSNRQIDRYTVKAVEKVILHEIEDSQKHSISVIVWTNIGRFCFLINGKLLLLLSRVKRNVTCSIPSSKHIFSPNLFYRLMHNIKPIVVIMHQSAFPRPSNVSFPLRSIFLYCTIYEKVSNLPYCFISHHVAYRNILQYFSSHIAKTASQLSVSY